MAFKFPIARNVVQDVQIMGDLNLEFYGSKSIDVDDGERVSA